MGFKGVNGMVMAEASTVSTRLLHPKMKILSSFTHQLFQTCMSFFLLLNTKEDILELNSCLAPLTSIVEKNGSQWCQSFFKRSFLGVQQKKETHTGLQQLEGE